MITTALLYEIEWPEISRSPQKVRRSDRRRQRFRETWEGHISENDAAPARDGFERRTRETKRRILGAARSLFFERGPSRTTMADIAGEAGVSPVSIYNHFAGKDALLEIVVREHLDASLDRVEAVLDLDLPFEEKLGRLLGPGDPPETGSAEELPTPTDEALAGFDWSDGKIRSIYESFVAERQVPFLERFVAQGKAEGVIDPTLSTDAILAYFDANMSIYRRDDLLSKGSEYLRSLSRLFFYGILGR